MTAARKTIFISSTSIDLPVHREKVAQACLEQGFFPDGMERWPAVDATALQKCLDMVDQADGFIGIYAHRYGWTPPGESKSITELEYDRAVARGIPRLLFLMDKKHPLLAGDVETGPGADALRLFKQRIQPERVRATFDNPDQLRAEVLHALGELGGQPAHVEDCAPRVDLTHLPEGAEHFLGRDAELDELDAAWADGGRTHIVELIAPGGVGKTSLVKRWLERIKADGWRGARRVYGWSFYSQGTGDDRQASDDSFLSEALAWFGVDIDSALNPWDKGRKLAEAVAATRTLLVLDGVEPLQYPPGPLAGDLRAPGVKALLQHLASAGQTGMCLLTSRERLSDLAEYECNDSHPGGAVLRRDLGNLGEQDGAKLLHRLGANKAGAAAIGPEDEELKQASREVKGHALTLSLLGRYLKLAYAGDIRRRDQVDFQEADAETAGGHAFKVMAAYEIWFARECEKGARELAALRLVGFFDRPATRGCLDSLRSAEAIKGLTEPLAGLNAPQWAVVLKRLEDCGLIYPTEDGGGIDAHTLVRKYFGSALRDNAEAWREGHRRLYRKLIASASESPKTMRDLQPLYQAVVHGCHADLIESALDDVYVGRILRGTGTEGYYSTRKLGAFGADLGAVACFFEEPWTQPIRKLSDADRSWLLNMAAIRLVALGRVEEAETPMRASCALDKARHEWEGAIKSQCNLSELMLVLGNISPAVSVAREALDNLQHVDSWHLREMVLATLAHALHQMGETEGAGYFSEAVSVRRDHQPDYPPLSSGAAFYYFNLVLSNPERIAWQVVLGGKQDANEHMTTFEVVDGWINEINTWRSERNKNRVVAVDPEPPLTLALYHLTLGRCALYRALLRGEELLSAKEDVQLSLDKLRLSGRQDLVPYGLLTRAWLCYSLKDFARAKTDLEEAWQIAARGNMRLHMADIHLTRARLFRDKAELAKARALIVQCEYFRRLPELEDAEAMLGVAP